MVFWWFWSIFGRKVSIFLHFLCSFFGLNRGFCRKIVRNDYDRFLYPDRLYDWNFNVFVVVNPPVSTFYSRGNPVFPTVSGLSNFFSKKNIKKVLTYFRYHCSYSLSRGTAPRGVELIQIDITSTNPRGAPQGGEPIRANGGEGTAYGSQAKGSQSRSTSWNLDKRTYRQCTRGGTRGETHKALPVNRASCQAVRRIVHTIRNRPII